jgi:hypothetical protein
MNEQKRAEQFSHEVDRLLAGGSPLGADDGEMLDVAARLAAADLSADTGSLREDIRQRMMAQNTTRKGWSHTTGDNPMKKNTVTRRLVFAGIALVLVLIASLALPPVRTFAEGILRRIGGITLSDNPTAIQEMEGTPMPTLDPNAEPLPTIAPPRQLSAEEAAALAGFPLYVPDMLPAGYELAFRDGTGQESGVASITTSYYEQPATRESGFLLLTQAVYPADAEGPLGEWAVGDAPISDVTVRGLPGVFVDGAPIMGSVDPEGNVETQGLNILIWEEEGYTFSLTSNTLSLEELLAIAESMHK